MELRRTVFAQLVDFLPRRAFENAVVRHRGDRRVRSLSCMDQLLCMLFAQITGRASLRETICCLDAIGPRLYHCGIRGHVARSTLADANENRSYRIFMDTALAMIKAARLELPVDVDLAPLDIDAYALDSTTIDLCLALFPWAHFRRRKAGIKAHTMLDLNVGIPVFVRITHAKTHDLWALDQFVPQAGAYYVVDKGYLDYARLYRLHSSGAFFVTRARADMDYLVRERRKVDHATGIRSDHLIRLRGNKSKDRYPDTLRLVHFVDPQTGKRLEFLTNNMLLDAKTVALLYRKRWKIELFFKWVKQHLHIKAFFGNSPNAVKSQVWIAVIAFVLITRFQHRYGLSHDTNDILQILSIATIDKTPIIELFSKKSQRSEEEQSHNQLSLF